MDDSQPRPPREPQPDDEPPPARTDPDDPGHGAGLADPATSPEAAPDDAGA